MLLLHIVTPETTYEYSNLAYINMQTLQWEVGIYPHHMDLITPLVAWEVCRQENKEYESLESYSDHTQRQSIPWWIAYLTQNHLTIITSEQTT